MALEYPPCVTTPSGYSAFYIFIEYRHQYEYTSTAHGKPYISIDAFRAVILVVHLARLALQARADLRAHPDAISGLELLDVVSDARHGADDLMARNERELALAPALRERVHVGAAHAAMCDSELDIVRFEGLRLEVDDCEILPLIWVCARVTLTL